MLSRRNWATLLRRRRLSTWSVYTSPNPSTFDTRITSSTSPSTSTLGSSTPLPRPSRQAHIRATHTVTTDSILDTYDGSQYVINYILADLLGSTVDMLIMHTVGAAKT